VSAGMSWNASPTRTRTESPPIASTAAFGTSWAAALSMAGRLASRTRSAACTLQPVRPQARAVCRLAHRSPRPLLLTFGHGSLTVPERRFGFGRVSTRSVSQNPTAAGADCRLRAESRSRHPVARVEGLEGADDVEVLVDEDVVRPVDADVVDLVLTVAQLHDTVNDAPRVRGKRRFRRVVR
jgi:hypothetical protein